MSHDFKALKATIDAYLVTEHKGALNPALHTFYPTVYLADALRAAYATVAARAAREHDYFADTSCAHIPSVAAVAAYSARLVTAAAAAAAAYPASAAENRKALYRALTDAAAELKAAEDDYFAAEPSERAYLAAVARTRVADAIAAYFVDTAALAAAKATYERLKQGRP